jgi:hypothetical protein
MAELEAEDQKAKSTEADAQAKAAAGEPLIEDANVKPTHKSVASLSATPGPSEPGSETSSINEDTLLGEGDKKEEPRKPRKLIEDEKRATGRVAWSVWKTYFGVSIYSYPSRSIWDREWRMSFQIWQIVWRSNR